MRVCVGTIFEGVLSLARQGQSTPKVLQVVVGSLCHCLGIERCCLSVLQDVYDVVGLENHTVVCFGDALIDEFVCAAYLCLAAEHWVGRPYAPVAFISDSSMQGYSLYVTPVAPKDFAYLVRCRERWRFQQPRAIAIEDLRCASLPFGSKLSEGRRRRRWVSELR